MFQNYVYENGQVFSVEEIETSTQTAVIKVHAPNVTYDASTNTFTEVPAPDPLTSAKSAKLTELGAAYTASFTNFQSSALGTVHTYPINQEAQDNMNKLMSLMTLNPNMSTINFKTLENGMTAHSRDQFIQVLMDAQTFEVNLAKQYEDGEANVTAATTVDQVNNIKW
jgi:hypothetical protein